MRYWTTIGDPRDYHRDPLPHSLLSTMQTGERERERERARERERERERGRERERESERERNRKTLNR